MARRGEKEILVTDSLFVQPEHEKLIRNEGFGIARLDKPSATEAELVSAVKGKAGYILGGIEKVTPKVIDAATDLEAIAFTGAGYKEFIPGHGEATKRGILISNAPGGNAAAVAEYTVSLMLAMTRNLFELGRTGSKSFETTGSLKEASVGIIGLGNIGLLVASQLRALGVEQIRYYSPRRKYHLETGLGITYAQMEDVLRTSDIVTLHVSKDAGHEFLSTDELKLMRSGALLVNCAYQDAVNLKALHKELKAGRIRAAFDSKLPDEFAKLPQGTLFYSNAQTGFNTRSAVRVTSEMVTRSILNLLKTGDDLFVVNPEAQKFRKRTA